MRTISYSVVEQMHLDLRTKVLYRICPGQLNDDLLDAAALFLRKASSLALADRAKLFDGSSLSKS